MTIGGGISVDRATGLPISHRTLSSTHFTQELAQCELDLSHADTCALRSNFTLLSYTGRDCDVSPYNTSQEVNQSETYPLSAQEHRTHAKNRESHTYSLSTKAYGSATSCGIPYQTPINSGTQETAYMTTRLVAKPPSPLSTANLPFPLQSVALLYSSNRPHPHNMNSTHVNTSIYPVRPIGIHTLCSWQQL